MLKKDMETSLPTLDIVSDPICPWCYIGKVKLDRALAARPGKRFEIQWRIFQLNPEMPPEGMDRRTYLETKFGGPDAAQQVYSNVEKAALAAGLEIDFGRIPRTPNTLDAHRLIRWARSGGRQHDLVGALFTAYFEEYRDIGDRDTLIEIGAEHGMDRELVTRLFEEDADRGVLVNEDALSRQMGISGVPCFILAEKYALVGAQETETWFDVLDKLDGGADPDAVLSGGVNKA